MNSLASLSQPLILGQLSYREKQQIAVEETGNSHDREYSVVHPHSVNH